ncbi:4-alpha-L-fucosyltransferase [Mortierella sp. GBA39]|nr:4-alpha-L-fucosyltransferase [Mortierella sp. GBA39]
MGMTISRNRIPRGFIIRSISLILLLLVIFQIYISHIQSQSPSKSWSSSSPANHNPNAKYLGTNNDELAQFPPTHDLERFCSSYPERRVKKHHILISNKAKEDGPLKIFYWKQESLSQEIDWHKESETMCPVPLELQSFFDHYRQTKVKDPSVFWKTGYAPCFFWKTWDNEIEDRPGSCASREYTKLDYIFSTNYTDFVNADIIYMDYASTMGIDKAPYFDQMLLPPRLAHQSWALSFFDESIGYYPHVAMPAFLNQFDLTMGSPPQLMDIPNPYYPITEKKALELAHIEPTHPFDKTPEHYIAFMTSNCASKNDRMGLIGKLVNTAGAHSYGLCGHNKEMPEELKGREAGSWQYKKQKTLASYPFGLAAENSNCLGHITEKIYDVYASGSIPIYMGAPDIADFVPEGSYIDVRKFKTYDDLIHYMKAVDREPFYRWKDIVKKDPTKFCKKCLYTGPSPWCTIMDNVHFV